MGPALEHILVGACISEGAFLYSKIWDFGDIVVVTDKVDGEEGTKLSAATVVTIYCVRRPILQVMMISVITQQALWPVQAVVLTNSHFHRTSPSITIKTWSDKTPNALFPLRQHYHAPSHY